ncbi:alpha/beta hydrolase family protein [Streptomyces albus]|uniref:alpha/beta hydrolase n=1 Tax=Streptomyces albus TaxID=1888 RepID=UPI0004C704B0|nr:alpha/beta hydrolase family protein [Streptomyces albus]
MSSTPPRRRILRTAAAAAVAGLAAPPLLGAAGSARADAGPALGLGVGSGPSSVPGHDGGGAQVIRERRTGERIVDLTLRSPALGGTADVRLLVPDGWDERGPRDRWPVLWLLPGGNAEHLAFTDEYGLQHEPSVRKVLVVMPSMPFYGFYTDWWNGGTGGPPAVESFHLRELRPLLERDYGAGVRRAVAGESQGGYGALKYAARHPGVFRAAASWSGFLHPLMYPDAVVCGSEYLGVEWRRIWGDPVRQRHIWEANDPYYLAPRLRGVRVHIASGDGTPGRLDPPDVEPDEDIPGFEELARLFPREVISLTESIMGDESRAVAYRLQQEGVRISTHFFRGTHAPAYWERELYATLPMLLGALRDR